MLAFIFLTQGGLSAAVSTPGFSFLGQGYDILKGNPLATTGFGDPGHRVDIFDFSYAEGNTTPDGRYRVADKATVDLFQACTSQVSVDVFNSMFSYKRLITKSFDLNANFGPASFSLGVDSKNVRTQTDNREEIYAHASAVCTAYQLTMFTGDQAPVNSNFQHFVKNLPLEYDEDAYMNMIKEFGTHYINRMKVGGRWGHQMVFKTSDYQALEDNSINVKLGVKAAVAEAGKAGGGLDLSRVNQRTTAYNITQSVKQLKTFNVGGEYREDSGEWMATVRDSPVPVHMSLIGLETLFTQEDLPMETNLANLEQKRANFVKATEEYCGYTEDIEEGSEGSGDWKIAYDDVWCGGSPPYDSLGNEPDMTKAECQERCLAESKCNFMLYGDNVWGNGARCVLFETCDSRSTYNYRDPVVYHRPGTGGICTTPPTEIPFPTPAPVDANAVRRICVKNSGGFAINWFLTTNGHQGSKQRSYPNPQTRCIDATVDRPKRGDKLSCRVKAVAGKTVDCEEANTTYDARSLKQANYVCSGTTLRIRCRLTGISGLSGNN